MTVTSYKHKYLSFSVGTTFSEQGDIKCWANFSDLPIYCDSVNLIFQFLFLTTFFIYIYLYILFLIKFFEREREREIVEVHYIADFIVLFLQCLIIKPSVISWESSTGKYKGKYHICCSICAKNAMNCLSLWTIIIDNGERISFFHNRAGLQQTETDW